MTFYAYDDKVVIADKYQSQDMSGGFSRNHIKDKMMITFNDCRKIVTSKALIDKTVIGWWMAAGNVTHGNAFAELMNREMDIWPVIEWQALSCDQKLVNETRYIFVPKDSKEPIITLYLENGNTKLMNNPSGYMGANDEYVSAVEGMLPGQEILSPLEAFVLASESSPHVTLQYDQLDRVTGKITYDLEVSKKERAKILRSIKKRLTLITKENHLPYLNHETERRTIFTPSV